jgi:hypothetical protein
MKLTDQIKYIHNRVAELRRLAVHGLVVIPEDWGEPELDRHIDLVFAVFLAQEKKKLSRRREESFNSRIMYILKYVNDFKKIDKKKPTKKRRKG